MSAAIAGAVVGGALAWGGGAAAVLGGAAAGAGLGATVGRVIGGGGNAGSGYGGDNLSIYDPYASYRPGAAADLEKLMNNPSIAMSSPGYQQQLQQGTKAQEAAAASSGKLQSGAESAALTGLGQSTFSSYYNTMLGQLSSLSGASQSPSNAAFQSQQGAVSGANQQAGNINALLQGVSGLQTATNFLGNSSGQQVNFNSNTSSQTTPGTYWSSPTPSGYTGDVGYNFNYGA